MESVHPVRNIIATNVKRLRKEKNITQAQLGEMTDLSTTYIANIECGKTWISDTTLEKLSQALEVEYHELFLCKAENNSEDTILLPANIRMYLTKLKNNNNNLLIDLENALKNYL